MFFQISARSLVFSFTGKSVLKNKINESVLACGTQKIPIKGIIGCLNIFLQRQKIIVMVVT